LLLDVWADWCGPCKAFAPIFEQAASRLVGRCRLAKLDSEANQRLAGQLGIRSIPSLILFKDGRRSPGRAAPCRCRSSWRGWRSAASERLSASVSPLERHGHCRHRRRG
jgi:hypothetical protein